MSVITDSILHDPVTFNNQNDLNLIIDERLKYDREYIILDRDKVQQCITDPDTLLTIFTEYEINILLKQASEMNYISEDEYQTLLFDHSQFYTLLEMNDIHELLFKQLSYVTRIPSISDLEANGLLDSIIRVIQLNPELLVEKDLVENYTEEILTNKLEENEYISFEKIELILNNQYDILHILETFETINLLQRVKPYLSFVTDDTINEVQTLIDNNDPNIDSVYSPNEIKIILDKEIELKNLLLKALTPETLRTLFEEFKTDLINVNLDTLINDKIQLLKDEMFGENYDDLISTQVDNYLTTRYHTVLNQMLATSFETFKNEFLTTDLQSIVENYFNILKDEFFGDNYTGLVELQVNNYLNNNFPSVTEQTVQLWILEEI